MRNYYFSLILGELIILLTVIGYSDCVYFVDLPNKNGSSLEYSQLSKSIDGFLILISPYVAVLTIILPCVIKIVNSICKQQSQTYDDINKKKSEKPFLPVFLLFLCFLFLGGILLELILRKDFAFIAVFFCLQLPILGILAVTEFLVRMISHRFRTCLKNKTSANN